MLRPLRRAVLCALCLGLTLSVGAAAASSAVPGLQSAALGCNDGTNLGLSLDPAATLALNSAVAAVNAFPAGVPALSCNVGAAPASGKNGPKDFVVGGG